MLFVCASLSFSCLWLLSSTSTADGYWWLVMKWFKLPWLCSLVVFGLAFWLSSVATKVCPHWKVTLEFFPRHILSLSLSLSLSLWSFRWPNDTAAVAECLFCAWLSIRIEKSTAQKRKGTKDTSSLAQCHWKRKRDPRGQREEKKAREKGPKMKGQRAREEKNRKEKRKKNATDTQQSTHESGRCPWRNSVDSQQQSILTTISWIHLHSTIWLSSASNCNCHQYFQLSDQVHNLFFSFSFSLSLSLSRLNSVTRSGLQSEWQLNHQLVYHSSQASPVASRELGQWTHKVTVMAMAMATVSLQLLNKAAVDEHNHL